MWQHNGSISLHATFSSLIAAALSFSVVYWLFWHHERACVVMIETTCPVILAQCVCWELFHPITPSVSSMWFLLSSTYILYFLVFLSFCDDFTNLEYCCKSAIICRGPQTHPVPFNRSLPLHELWCIYRNHTPVSFWRLWSMGLKLLEKHNLFSLSNAPLFIYKWCRSRESL